MQKREIHPKRTTDPKHKFVTVSKKFISRIKKIIPERTTDQNVL